MRAGITCMIEHSVYSSGITNTAMAIAELCKGLGYSPTLLNMRGTMPWWDDCGVLKQVFPVQHLDDMVAGMDTPFDILFEIGPLTLRAAQRSLICRRSIWVVRKSFALQEIESSIFPIVRGKRDLEGISEAWLLEGVTDPNDVTTLETLARVPVRHVPFLWTPLISEVFLRSIGSPKWCGDAEKPLFLRMVDTNITSSSSSTIPLVIIREMGRRKIPIAEWKLHNGEAIVKSKFFRENVLKHCTESDLSGACVGRQRCVNWAKEENCVALIHLRFNRLRPILLDLAWAGIPVVHNSPAFRDIGNGADRLFYENNSVSQGADAFQNLLADLRSSSGWFSATNTRREEILRRWSPISGYVKTLWGNALADTMKSMPIALTPAVPEKRTVVPNSKEVLRIVFSDMWESFVPNYNFFTVLLNEAGKTMVPPRRVLGYDSRKWNMSEDPDLVIFGPFAGGWQRFGAHVPKVNFTGENTRPIFGPGIDLSLGFDHLNMTPFEKYIRFPLWMMYINWFCADIEKLQNPKPIPLELCTRNCFPKKTKFCAFVVTNPGNPVRNEAFKWLSQYKTVDSGGKLHNNLGYVLPAAFGGGGGGEIVKVKFYSDYKFCFAYENGSHPGYSTEKFLHAKVSGCVPIYWGDSEAHRHFDLEGAIDARAFKTPAELQEAVRKIDMDDELYQKKVSRPFMSAYSVDIARRTLSELGKRLWELLGATGDDLKTVPRFLGAAAGSTEASFGMEMFSAAEASVEVIEAPIVKLFAPEVPIVITYATWKFLGSLNHWLAALSLQTQALPTLTARIFNGGDIPDETVKQLQEKFPFATFETVPSESLVPTDFPDFWDPAHYAWKLWVYYTMATRPEFKDRMVLYMDAGSVLCQWPMGWLRAAQEAGICCLEDPREENDVWCTPKFCKDVKVTEEERAAKQIVAGLMYFRSGHELAVAFFTEAFRLGQIRSVLVGPRLSGVGSDGKSYGHRQDQSVLSILVRRFPIPLLPLDTVYGDHSMRRTVALGQSIYVHRGNFNTHLQVLPGIDDAFVINLDRRGDRLEKFFVTHPELQGAVTRWQATDGKTLQISAELATLFAPNDFFWKKSVMGCAVSHLGLWWKLVNEQIEIGTYLIFEDDAKLAAGWRDTLAASMEHVPEDYDVLYLGGILPPNRAGYESVLEPVTKYYSRIRPNMIFGQKEPTAYFHSCAYAYVLSRRGATKIIEMIRARGGYWTSADHVMCGPNSDIKAYFLTPTVAGCYQDDDPAYASSEFNNFSRVDSFDSDLWNNDERFSKEEISGVGKCEDVSIGDLLDVVLSKRVAAPIIAPIVVAPVVESVILTGTGSRPIPIRFVCLKQHALDFKDVYEKEWLFRLFGGITAASVEAVDSETPTQSLTDCPIFILQRPHVQAATALLKAWNRAGVKFKILHLSDEFVDPALRDNLVAYTFPGCISILRFYIRDDFPEGTESKISVLPLGYRWRVGNSKGPVMPLPFRDIHWSFAGTNWQNRSALMKPLTDSKLNYKCKFLANWNDLSGLSEADYLDEMRHSIFVPCPGGQNPETFRFYEALESGCIPLVLKTAENEQWFRWVSEKIPLVALGNWDDGLRIMMNLLSNPARLELYRERVLTGWLDWVKELEGGAQKWLR